MTPTRSNCSKQIYEKQVMRLLGGMVEEFNRDWAASRVFTWLDPVPQAACDRPIPPTTNDVEGGINAPLKDLRRRHQGLPARRQRILTDWHLAPPTENPPDPVQFLLNPQPDQPRHAHTDTLFGV